MRTYYFNIFQIRLLSDLFVASNDDFIKEFNLVVLKAIHENVNVYSLIHSGKLKVDVYTPPQDHVSWVYVYITRKVYFSKVTNFVPKTGN